MMVADDALDSGFCFLRSVSLSCNEPTIWGTACGWQDRPLKVEMIHPDGSSHPASSACHHARCVTEEKMAGVKTVNECNLPIGPCLPVD